MSLFSIIFRTGSDRFVRELVPLVEAVNAYEPELETLDDVKFEERTSQLRARVGEGESLDGLLPEAFALVRRASALMLAKRHFDVQIMGGITLHRGKIAEMKTGEGKTLVATLPAYLNALTDRGVHIITVNDYLARRDAVWMGQIYSVLGLTVGCIVHDAAYLYDPAYGVEKSQTDSKTQTVRPAHRLESQIPNSEQDKERDTVGGFRIVESYLRPVSRKEAYAADITYGTNNEFGFDYLRDNMAYSLNDMVQRGHHYAIVDEVDSILIDEARTPLIISMPDEESTKLYQTFRSLVPRLQENTDYNIDAKFRAVTLTDAGVERVVAMLGFNIYDPGGIRYVHALEQSLRAHALFQRDRDYIVRNGEVIIVDEFTGRLMPGRRWSEGLHQAVEAKEGVKVQQESRTLATITFQNYFRMYEKLSGMTGTALTSAEEFDRVYKLDVVPIPTHRSMIREDLPDKVYKTEAAKFQAVAEEIKTCHDRGQPVLVGTISIEKNERLSKMIKHMGVPHEVLNAKNHEQEGAIIAQAGHLGAVTVATNMAGRGVDIILGGNPPEVEEQERVRTAGGLHVIGTERHEARRIDNQLRGRSGRQGDSGSSQFFVSLEDEIMRIFGGERLKSLMDRLNIPEDMPIEHSLVSKSIESAQAKIEGHNFDIRKHVLEYDEVMNKHRATVYERRRRILGNEDVSGDIVSYIDEEIEKILNAHASEENPETWNKEEIFEIVRAIAPQEDATARRGGADDRREDATARRYDKSDQDLLGEPRAERAGEGGADDRREDEITKKIYDLRIKNYESRGDLENTLKEFFHALLEERRTRFDPGIVTGVEKTVMLRMLDTLWVEHLETMEHLRDSVRLRAYGQRDPLVEYKSEAHKLFEQFLASFQMNVVNMIFKIAPAGSAAGSTQQMMRSDQSSPQIAETEREMRRNDPCPCGSGKKYKKCGLINTEEHQKLVAQK